MGGAGWQPGGESITQEQLDQLLSGALPGLGIALGKIYPGSISVYKFGAVADMDGNDVPATIWDGVDNGGEDLYPYSSSADIDQLVSSDGGDNQEVEVQGLDTDWKWTVQTKNLNGTTPSTLDTPLRRIFRLKNNNNTQFAGTITCYINGGSAGTPADVRAIIPFISTSGEANEQTEMALFTAPDEYTTVLLSYYQNLSRATTTGTKEADIKFYQRTEGGVFRTQDNRGLNNTGTGDINRDFVVPKIIPARTDIEMRCIAVSTNNCDINAGFELVMIPNSVL